MSSKIYAGVVAGLSLFFAPYSFAAIKEYHLNINQGLANVIGKPVQRITHIAKDRNKMAYMVRW